MGRGGAGRVRGKPSSAPNGRTWNAVDPGRVRAAEASRVEPRRQTCWQAEASGALGRMGGIAGSVSFTSAPTPAAASHYPPAAPSHEPLAHFLPPPLRPWHHFLCKTGQPQALAGSAFPARPLLLPTVAARGLSPRGRPGSPAPGLRCPPSGRTHPALSPTPPVAGKMRAGFIPPSTGSG